jgi:hypothetical protein
MIDNQSSAKLTNVQILLSGSVLKVGSVPPHGWRVAVGVPRRDGLAEISLEAGKQSVRGKIDYVTPGISRRYTIILSDSSHMIIVVR